MSLTPTTEQVAAVELARTGRSVAIQAGAGTGKTATLQLIAEDRPELIFQFVAFNKAIVTDAAERMPQNVHCNTAHSLAFRAVGKRYAHRLRSSKRMLSIDLANRLALDPLTVTTFSGEKKQLSRSFLAGLTMRGITRFCQSADEEPSYRHVPLVDGLDAIGPGPKEVNRVVGKWVEDAMRYAWRDLTNTRGSLPYKHEHYLKLAQLERMRIYSDVILFDEAQDANPVLIEIVRQQVNTQVVWVGDSQQQIYAFTGAINALDNVAADDQTYLTQSFRFGPPIADLANSVLSTLDAKLRLTGTTEINSTVGAVAEPDCILTRTNATAIRELMEKLRQGYSVAIVGGGKELVSFARGAQKLMDGERTDHPELACFESWTEVIDYVQQDEQGGDLLLMVNLIE